ncbi:TetR family transcriptional regulator [Streptomyces triticirhizae]|uniref:TetR family transcriptional regulator n=1 Tax=Streptomyces triticirhizae TaxID=2483353 RepID=A0A3M2LSD5_9ACTN|nr:TetR family transcriptional regulator [Streptomyces triticirhizae]RMI40391.1 TetR family transcriptional regulator [Streptomyces triticirhizae]
MNAACSVSPLGLRERKKLRTRRAIRDAAYRLFAEQGFDATTVDRIAAAANVSTSTFFRYFPTKEELVLSEDPPARSLSEELAARPADEPPLTALRNALHAGVERARSDPGALRRARQRMELIASVPSIRDRLHEAMAGPGRAALARALATRTGRAPDSLETNVLVGAVLGAFREALLHWAGTEPDTDVTDLFDRTVDALARDLTT